MPIFSKDIGIDLGTANTLIYVKDKGIIINEPSVVAYDKEKNRVIAVGNEAKAMFGRAPREIAVIKPLRDGVIANFGMAEEMLRHFILKALRKTSLIGPRIVIGVPSEATEVEKRAVEDVALKAGARQAYVIEEAIAAAIGASLPISEPTGSMIVDIGGGTTEIAVVSLGGIVTSRSLAVAGNQMDFAIMNAIRKEYNLLIGDSSAEEIKIQIGSALPYDFENPISIKGRDLVSGLPKTVLISPEMVRNAIAESVNSILDAIVQTLERTPPELSSDVILNGIFLSGGGANLRNLDKLITMETGIKTYVAENAAECAALGTGIVLDEMRAWHKVVVSYKKRA